MKQITKEQVEAAIQKWKAAKIKKAELDGKLKDAEDVIAAYSTSHLSEFADGRLPMDSGILAIKAGVAKPVVDGKALSTVARAELAAMLPPQYVTTACNFMLLFGATDKTVRQILSSKGIEIVRDDKFTVI